MRQPRDAVAGDGLVVRFAQFAQDPIGGHRGMLLLELAQHEYSCCVPSFIWVKFTVCIVSSPSLVNLAQAWSIWHARAYVFNRNAHRQELSVAAPTPFR